MDQITFMKQHILIIDDDQDELMLFEDALEKVNSQKSFHCTHSVSATEALKILKNIMPDYIFVDFNMPEMNGIEFLNRLNKEGHLGKTKVYLHSMKITD